MYYGTRQSYDDLKHATFLVFYRSNHSPDTLATSMPIPLLPPVTKQCFPFRVILEFVPSKARRRYQNAKRTVPPPTIMVHTTDMRPLWVTSIETIASILIATCFPARDLTRFAINNLFVLVAKLYSRALLSRNENWRLHKPRLVRWHCITCGSTLCPIPCENTQEITWATFFSETAI